MSALAWVIIIAAIVAIVGGLFVLFRLRQRRGDVFAAAPAGRDGGSR